MNAQGGFLPLTFSPLTGDPGFVGRAAELPALENFLHEATVEGGARMVCGQAGAGKSALLDATVRAAGAAGMRVLRCAGIRGSHPPDLSGVLQIVWPVLADPHRSPHRSPHRPPTAADDPPEAVDLAAPDLDALVRVLVDGAPVPGDGRSWPAFAVLETLVAVSRAGHPLLVAVDDWDALDEPSRDVLTFVARRVQGHPLALLMTSRPHRALPNPLAGLPTLRLGPLSPAESALLLASRRPGLDAQTGRELLATAAGNPLALLELPVPSEDSPPAMPASSDRLASAFAPGAARLPAGTRDLLLVAALHPEGDLPLLLSAASRIGGTALDFAALEAAERAGLVAFDDMRAHFGHPATAGAVVHGTDPRRCRAAHAALAAVLAPGSVRMLWHRSQAVEGHDPELAARLEAVHGDALEQCEPTMAVRLLRRAADLHPEPADRGRCALRAAQLAQLFGLDRVTRTMAHRALRHPLGPLGTLCAEALARTGKGGAPRPTSTAPDPAALDPTDPSSWPTPVGPAEQDNALELVRITAPVVAGDDKRSQALLAFLDGIPDRADDPRLLHAMATVSPLGRAATVLAGVSADRHRTDLPVRDVERLGEAALLAGDPVRALDLFRQAERRRRFHALPDQLPWVLLRQGLAHLAMGNWGQAEHAFRRCAELAEGAYGQDHHRAAARLLEDLVRALRTGVPVDPVDPLAGAGRDVAAARRSVPSIDAVLAVGTAWALVEGGRSAAALPTLSSLLTDPSTRAVALFALVTFAEAAKAEHATREALATLDRMETELGPGCPRVIAVRFTVARAVLADDQDAEARYERAFGEDLSRWPYLEAPLRLAEGRWLRLRRQFADSRATLRQAAAGFTMLGAEARAPRIAAELRASGERADGGTPGTPGPTAARDLLTARELRIAELAARGLSNREIGEELGLASRTIGAYLYRVFPRLGVTSRAQLAEALRDPHPP
ncbi:AAA family ATPase [Streptomyces sp. YU58]|uniref:AAA family ATPase n=1 Tax=Streptomyces sp. SX92 TaxID=3158972 RepID=UPI0027B922AB|nr:LuxR family transcriptional regulator [Streptomyces coralus]WLW57298.1 LuxR C-terminal-related transcriptional regulator [Streptomyces coralus]